MADNDEGLLDTLMRAIPGYGAYRDQESRRADDRQTRDFLARRLGDVKSSLDQAGKAAVSRGDLDLPHQLESVRGKVDHCQQRLTAAVEGYAGWFNERTVDTELLERVAKLDSDLISVVDLLDAKAKQPEPAADVWLNELQQICERLGERIDRRAEILKRGS